MGVCEWGKGERVGENNSFIYRKRKPTLDPCDGFIRRSEFRGGQDVLARVGVRGVVDGGFGGEEELGGVVGGGEVERQLAAGRGMGLLVEPGKQVMELRLGRRGVMGEFWLGRMRVRAVGRTRRVERRAVNGRESIVESGDGSENGKGRLV